MQLGEIVQPGQSLMTIVPLEDVWVTANFKETQLAHVRAGQRAEVYVDMYGRSFPARVDSIAGATVKLLFDKIPNGVAFRRGMNVDASIFTK